MLNFEKEREALLAEIELFVAEAMKAYVVERWADSYQNTEPFAYVINDKNEVWWMKSQADQLWKFWNAAKKLDGSAVVQTQGLVLTCEQLLEALEFGAPDLKIERTEYSEEQMSTEIAIVQLDTGHSGSGLYAYCTECPEEGSIKLGIPELDHE